MTRITFESPFDKTHHDVSVSSDRLYGPEDRDLSPPSPPLSSHHLTKKPPPTTAPNLANSYPSFKSHSPTSLSGGQPSLSTQTWGGVIHLHSPTLPWASLTALITAVKVTDFNMSPPFDFLSCFSLPQHLKKCLSQDSPQVSPQEFFRKSLKLHAKFCARTIF